MAALYRIMVSQLKKTKMIQSFCAILAVAVCVFLIHEIIVHQQKGTYAFTSRMVDAIDIEELSTSKLIYNGIVDVYDESGQKVLYSMTYDSTVKVGIQVSDIELHTDAEQKTVKIALPPITIQSPVVDPSSISFIPHSTVIDLKEALAACREDARNEAEKSSKLIHSAEENLKSIIEALTLPIIKTEGYTIVW